MPRFSPSLLLLGALILPPAAAVGEDSLPDPRRADLHPAARLDTLVERIRVEHSRMRTLEAEFVQHKESELLLKPQVATGLFSYAAPDRVRWEYESPNPISLLIYGDEMTTWYRDIGQAEKIHVGRQSQRVLEYLGAGSSLAKLTEYFSVALSTPDDTNAPYRLDMKPRYARIAKRLQEMSLWIHSSSFLLVRVRYIESDGDVTDYRFHNLRINRTLPADRFEIRLPAEVDLREVDLDTRASLR